MFLAVVVAAALSGGSGNAPAPPDGTYNYSIIQAGTQIGTSSLILKRLANEITIHETQTLGDSSFIVDERVDASTLAPESYIATYSKGTGSQTARAGFDSKGATVSLDGVSGTQDFPLSGGVRNAYVVEMALMTGYFLLPAQIRQSRSSQFMQVIPSEVESMVTRVTPQALSPRPASTPANDASISVASKVDLDEWYDPGSLVLDTVAVPIQNVVIKRTK